VQTSLDEWRRVIAVNLDGVFLGVKHAIRAMTGRGGAIVNVSSTAGLVGSRSMAPMARPKREC
jgi:NAD(P)-dependent dehydrogenase (short-subunit alcohol dehydrogenase family)